MDQVWGGAGGGSQLKVARTFRTLRMLRMVRLARLMKMPKFFQSLWFIQALVERIRSEKSILVFGILKIVIVIVWVAHFLSGFWYKLGKWRAWEGERSWVDELISD